MHKSLCTYKYPYRLKGFESSNTSSSFSISLNTTTLTLSGDSSLAQFKLAEGVVLANEVATLVLSWDAIDSTHTVRGKIALRSQFRPDSKIRIFFSIFLYLFFSFIHGLLFAHTFIWLHYSHIIFTTGPGLEGWNSIGIIATCLATWGGNTWRPRGTSSSAT